VDTSNRERGISPSFKKKFYGTVLIQNQGDIPHSCLSPVPHTRTRSGDSSDSQQRPLPSHKETLIQYVYPGQRLPRHFHPRLPPLPLLPVTLSPSNPTPTNLHPRRQRPRRRLNTVNLQIRFRPPFTRKCCSSCPSNAVAGRKIIRYHF
jgi:hypothetical protein